MTSHQIGPRILHMSFFFFLSLQSVFLQQAFYGYHNGNCSVYSVIGSEYLIFSNVPFRQQFNFTLETS